MSQLIDLTVKDYLAQLGSNQPAPGGGSASALSGAQGISLVKMVCELSLGRKKYAEFEEENKKIHAETIRLQEALLLAIDKDTQAYNEVSAVFSLPKETDDEKRIRQETMQKALQNATLVPLEVMELAVESIEVAARAVGKTNVNAASDLGVAAVNLSSALEGAWLNVLINLSSIKDETFVHEKRAKADELREQGQKNAQQLFNTIAQTM